MYLTEHENIENNGIRKRKRQKAEIGMEMERGRARGGKRVQLPRHSIPKKWEHDKACRRKDKEGKCRFKSSLGGRGTKI